MSRELSLEQLSVLPPRSRAEQLADMLAVHCQEMKLQAGDRVGTLEEIRAEVGYARATISEAVRLLRERGVLEIRPGRGGGLFVAEQTPVVRLRHTLLKSVGSVGHVRDAIELREGLEAPVAVATSRVVTEKDAERLRAQATAMGRCGNDFSLFMGRNWALHEDVANLCPNQMMAAVYSSCLGYLADSTPLYDDQKQVAGYLQVRAAIHVRLINAIIEGDEATIRQAVIEHNDANATAGEESSR